MSTDISLNITVADEGDLHAVIEHIARAATGFALDGHECFMSVGPGFVFDEDDSEVGSDDGSGEEDG